MSDKFTGPYYYFAYPSEKEESVTRTIDELEEYGLIRRAPEIEGVPADPSMGYVFVKFKSNTAYQLFRLRVIKYKAIDFVGRAYNADFYQVLQSLPYMLFWSVVLQVFAVCVGILLKIFQG